MEHLYLVQLNQQLNQHQYLVQHTSTFGATQPTQTTNIFGSTLTGATQMGTTVKYDAVAGQGKINKFSFSN